MRKFVGLERKIFYESLYIYIYSFGLGVNILQMFVGKAIRGFRIWETVPRKSSLIVTDMDFVDHELYASSGAYLYLYVYL